MQSPERGIKVQTNVSNHSPFYAASLPLSLAIEEPTLGKKKILNGDVNGNKGCPHSGSDQLFSWIVRG